MTDNVPSFLTSKTKEELVRKMLLNNIKQGFSFQYFDIQKDGKNWVCWYYRKTKMVIGSMTNG